jgi:aldehyde:ferredoxin oxidoreductase
MALGFAVQTRGADHNRSGAYENDFSENSNRLEITNDSAIGAIESENKAAIIDSLILCKFVRRALDDFYADAATMLNLITGAGFTKTELQTTAERIVAARKLYNINSGWVPADDTLPDRFFEDSCGEFNQRIDRQKFQSAIQCYNLARGWNADGTIDVERLRQLDLATDQKRRLTKSSLTNN